MLALEDLTRLADTARQRIVDSTADQADLREGLHDMVGQLRELIVSGQPQVELKRGSRNRLSRACYCRT